MGTSNDRQQIVDYLEKQLFSSSPRVDEVSYLCFDMWLDLKKDILSGKYKDSQ